MIDVYVTGPSVDIGRQGENNARNVYFDLTDLTTDYGEGTATLVHMRPSDQVPYVCETETDGSYLVWTPSSTDTAYSGAGKCELRWVVGETLAKSIIYTTTIAPSITGAGEVPSPYKSWYDAIIAYIEANYAANGAPQEVREAIYTLLSQAAYTETGLTDELAIVQAWTAETISVTNNLTNCTNSNTATMAELGGSYTGTLTADSGYTLGTVTVTMGGEDVTATVYSSGTITIPSVTGNIVITATAVVAVSSISAVYTQSGTVYTTDSIEDLRSDLVVTATYSDSSTATVTDYTLSGTLTEGTSTVTISYGGKTTTFNVTVTVRGALYPLENGTHTFTANGRALTVSDGKYFSYTNSNPATSGTGGYILLSHVSENDTSGTSNTNFNRTTPWFTIPSGASYSFSFTNITLENLNTTNYSIAFRNSSGTALITTTDRHVTDDITITGTASQDLEVTSLGLYVRNSYSLLAGDISLTVNGETWI